MACELARDAGNFFEELDSWKALRSFYERHENSTELQRCAARINEMEKMLNEREKEGCEGEIMRQTSSFDLRESVSGCDSLIL